MNDDNVRFFQWIMGDRKGEVMIFDKIESEGSDIFIVFKDNSRINENLVAEINEKDLTGKFMAEIDSPNNTWSFKDEWVGREEERWEWRDETNPTEKVCVQPVIPGRKVTKLIPPKPTPKTKSNFGAITILEPVIKYVEIEKPVEKKTDTSDPIYILMSTSKKIDTEIDMNIIVSLPPQTLYNIAKESFDEGQKKIVEYIIENITVNEIKEALKIAITKMYENLNGPHI